MRTVLRASLQRPASLKDRIDELPIFVADLHSVEDGVLNFLDMAVSFAFASSSNSGDASESCRPYCLFQLDLNDRSSLPAFPRFNAISAFGSVLSHKLVDFDWCQSRRD